MIDPTPAQSRAIAQMMDQIDPEKAFELQLSTSEEQLAYFREYEKRKPMVDLPPPPAAIQQAESPADLDSWLRSRQPPAQDPFSQWQSGATSPWDPSGFPSEGIAPPTVTIEERAQLAHNSGFRGKDLVTAVAISMAENETGDPWAMGPYDSTDNVGDSDGKWHRALGLWQIRPLTDPNDPEWSGDSWRKFEVLLDPQENANAAKIAFDKSGFEAWVTYRKKLHERFLPEARAVVRQLGLS